MDDEMDDATERMLREQGLTDADIDELRRTGRVERDGVEIWSSAKVISSVSPDDVTNLESTFGLDIDGDGRVGDVPAHDTADVHVRHARPDATPTPDAAPTPTTGGDPFVSDRRGARRWWPLLIGLAIGIALAYWYFSA